MNRPTPRHMVIDSDAILHSMSERQFLRPHQPMDEALQWIADELKLCPGAVERALNWLEVDAARRIGRFRRSELSQLAKSIHRIWRQAAGVDSDATTSH